MNMPLVLLNRRRRGFTAFSPSTLFALAEPGVWYDPSDLSTLFQDTAGTTPLTTPGQTVALMLDKSKGLALGTELVVNGTFNTNLSGWTAGATWVWDSSGAAKSTGTFGSLVQLIGARSSSKRISFSYVKTSLRLQLQVQDSTGVNANISFGGEGDLSTLTGGAATGTISLVTPPGYDRISFITTDAGALWALDNISVKELAGNHAVQATAASRPTYGVVPLGGRRNLLTYSEQFDNGAWLKTSSTITANAAIAPDGATTAEKIVASTATDAHLVQPAANANVPVGEYVLSVYAKKAEYDRVYVFLTTFGVAGTGVWFNLSDGTVGTAAAGRVGTIQSVGNGWYRCSVRYTFAINSNTIGLAFSNSETLTYAGDGTSGVYVWGAQLELGSTATAYQRTTTQFDVTEAGVQSLSYLSFDGVDDFMVTGTITPGVDKVTVAAGVRKLSDAAYQSYVSISPNVNSNAGSFEVTNGTPPAGAVVSSYGVRFRGSSVGSFAGVSGIAVPPSTDVLTALGDIAADTTILRVDGVQRASVTDDLGTGNFLAYPLNIGRRGDGTVPSSIQIYSLVTRFAATDLATVAQLETWINGKTGAYS